MNAPRTRVQRRPVHGVLLLDKPLGLSSNDALQKVKWLLRAEKAGHGGTLDPLASGVLVLCFGAATKFIHLHLDADKTYEAIVRLGSRTSTGDAEGEMIDHREVNLTPGLLEQVQAQFTGEVAQIPPMYSALKLNGKPLYEYARAGVDVAREARKVHIRELSLTLATDITDYVALRLRATVSKGTYIRTLGEDIGEALGCGGHLTALRRLSTIHFTTAGCVTLSQLEAMSEEQRLASLMPVDCMLEGHQRVTLDEQHAARFLSGLRRRGNWSDADEVAVYGARPQALLGTAHVRAGELIPGRLLSPIEIQQILKPMDAQAATLPVAAPAAA